MRPGRRNKRSSRKEEGRDDHGIKSARHHMKMSHGLQRKLSSRVEVAAQVVRTVRVGLATGSLDSPTADAARIAVF